MGIFIKIGILHTLKCCLHTLSCDFWLNLCQPFWSNHKCILEHLTESIGCVTYFIMPPWHHHRASIQHLWCKHNFIDVNVWMTGCAPCSDDAEEGALIKTRTTRTPAIWDTPTATWLPIWYTSDSHQIPSQKKTKSRLQFLNKANLRDLKAATGL